MAKIESYPLAPSTISGNDKMIGTDTANNNATKNFTVNQLISYIGFNGGFVPYTGAVENVNLGSQVLYATGGIFYGTIQATNVNAIGGLLINSSAGSAGQVLVSQGTGVPPIWSSSTITGPQGVQGPIGPTGLTGPVGPAGLNWQSSWVSGTSYVIDDAVGYAGASWFCILATSGTTTPDLDTTHWALLASQGAVGAAGATGAQGPTGATGATGATGVSGNNTLQQVLDLNHNLVDAKNYQGTLAGLSNTGINVNAFGAGAAQGNTDDNVNAFGYQAGLSNTGINLNAFGETAGISNGGINVNTFGFNSGVSNSYSYVNLFGYNASATTNNQTVLAGQTYSARLSYNGLTADRLYTFPDKNGTFAMLSDLTGSGWSLTGNAGTNPLVNFIGTTDAKDVIFKANGVERMKIDNIYGDVYADKSFRAYNAVGATSVQATGGNGYAIMGQDNFFGGGFLQLANLAFIDGTIRCDNVTASREYQLPNADGTLALVNASAFSGSRTINSEVYTWVNGILISVV